MWVAWLLVAAQWYVDGDAKDCADSKNVVCTLQEAFDSGLQPGDEILVRDAAMPYAGASLTGVDGMDGAPIVLRPDDGHTPVIFGRVELLDSSHWAIRGLTFDGTGGEPDDSAIVIGAAADEVEGIVIEDNAIFNWGGEVVEGEDVGSGIIHLATYVGDDAVLVIEPVVRNNRVIASVGKAIYMGHVQAPRIEGNEAAELTCQVQYTNPTTLEYVAGMVGMHLYFTPDAEISRNRFHDFDATECSLDPSDKRVSGVFLERTAGAEIHHNFMARLGGESQAGQGVALINSSSECSIHHNVVIDVDQCGLCNGVLGSAGGSDARFVANTVIGGRGSGLMLWGGERTEFVDNVVVGAAVAQAYVLRTAEIQFEGGVTDFSFENNLYFGDNIGKWEYQPSVDLATWQGECMCDMDSFVADPLVTPGATENFTPATGSPAVDAAIAAPELAVWNGEAPDLGAVEAPLVVGASIGAGEPDRIRLALQSETSPLRYDKGCSGFVVTRDDEAIATVGCELDGELVIRLESPAYAGDTIHLGYAGTAISNSDAIGGSVHGLLQPFEIEVANASDEVPPAESGAATSGESSGETGSTDAPSSTTTDGVSDTDTDGGAADYPGADGCSCRTQSPASVLWMLVLGLVRRRR